MKSTKSPLPFWHRLFRLEPRLKSPLGLRAHAPEVATPALHGRLADAAKRLKEVDTLLATLDRTFEFAAERNVAVSATAFGGAWHEVNSRAKVARSFTKRELDALLDGDVAKANSCRRCRDRATDDLLACLDAFEEELAHFASEN